MDDLGIPPDLATLAADSLAALRELSRLGVVRTAIERVDEPWCRECHSRLGDTCCEVIGVYDLTGPDDETPWPAAVVRVTRTPWKHGQHARVGYIGVYLSEHSDWAAVYFDGLKEGRKRCAWPIPDA